MTDVTLNMFVSNLIPTGLFPCYKMMFSTLRLVSLVESVNTFQL